MLPRRHPIHGQLYRLLPQNHDDYKYGLGKVADGCRSKRKPVAWFPSRVRHQGSLLRSWGSFALMKPLQQKSALESACRAKLEHLPEEGLNLSLQALSK